MQCSMLSALAWFSGVREESGTFVQVTLTGLSVDEINELDELEGEQSEAAGD